MAIGAFVEGAPADGGEGYSGRVTPFVVLSCVVAGSGGVLFGYDLGISGSSRAVTLAFSFGVRRFSPPLPAEYLEEKKNTRSLDEGSRFNLCPFMCTEYVHYTRFGSATN
jgi:hypothetical protein